MLDRLGVEKAAEQDFWIRGGLERMEFSNDSLQSRVGAVVSNEKSPLPSIIRDDSLEKDCEMVVA